MDEEIYEDIGRYVAGEMDEQERRAFERRLEADPTLKEQVTLFRSVSESLATRFQREEDEKKFRANLSGLAEEHITEHDGRSSRLKWYSLAAAASVILCAVIFYKPFSSKPSYDEYAVFEPLALAGRGQTDSLKILAEHTFNEKQYDDALAYIDAILKEEPSNTELKMYKGIALLQLDRYPEANAIFDSIRITPSIYRDHALWLRALSALKQKEYNTCRSMLEEIKPGADDYKKAQALLDEL